MKKITFFRGLVIISALFVFIPYKTVISATGDLLVGISKVNITPETGTVIWGGYGRKEPSLGIHDSLYVRILVLDVKGYRMAVISCDLLKYTDKRIFDIAKEKYNISYVLLCSSHSHSGPIFNDYYMPDYSIPYAQTVLKRITDGFDKAVKNMFPAHICAGKASLPALTYNRLIMQDDGHARALFQNRDKIPYGPVDSEVGIIKIEDKNKNTRVVLINYACHPVVNGANYEVSADYPGVVTKKVEEAFGNNTTCMFVQGAAGNINPLSISIHRVKPDDVNQTDYTLIDKMGSFLANGIIKEVKNLSPEVSNDASLNVMTDSLKFTGRFNKQLNYNVHFTTVLINNDIAIATIPAEAFIEFQFFWKKHAEMPNPLFFGYTYSSGGDFTGYVPDIRSAAYGGYGADYEEEMIEIGAGEAIMNKQLENLYRLRGITRDKPGPK